MKKKKIPAYQAWLLKKRDREQATLVRASSSLWRQTAYIQSWKYSHETVTSANSEVQAGRFHDIMPHFMKSHVKNILCPNNSVLWKYNNLEMLMTTSPGQDTQKQIFCQYGLQNLSQKARLQDDTWGNKISTGDLVPLYFAFKHLFSSMKITLEVLSLFYITF